MLGRRGRVREFSRKYECGGKTGFPRACTGGLSICLCVFSGQGQLKSEHRFLVCTTKRCARDASLYSCVSNRSLIKVINVMVMTCKARIETVMCVANSEQFSTETRKQEGVCRVRFAILGPLYKVKRISCGGSSTSCSNVRLDMCDMRSSPVRVQIQTFKRAPTIISIPFLSPHTRNTCVV